MLDAVCKYLPSPVDKDSIEGIHPDDGFIRRRSN
jgi:elongation factor G